MKRFKHSDLVDSKLHQLFQKLSMQSKEAIIDEYEFDEFKDYMHIEREIERKFENKINDQLIKHPKNLLLIVGNVGDGKSHMWSSVKKKDTLNIINLHSAKQHTFLHDHKVISYCNGCESF